MDSIEKKIFLISLGCAKNLVDSENLLGMLKERGFSVVSGLEGADVVIINTCGFIGSAVEESIETIFELVSRKKAGELERLFVVGCFVQRYGYKLRREIPEVDGWLGTGEIYRITELLEADSDSSPLFFIGRPTFLADHNTPRIQTTPFYSAYLKIAEGCSHKCSFCSIPGIRGRLRSREIDSLIIEARKMVDSGVKEINLIAQDTTMYGKDLSGNTGLEDLLEKLLLIRGLKWIRILYSHPLGISDRLLKLMEGEEAICPYLDLPFQHVNNKILQTMGRVFCKENPLQLIERIRSITRRLSIRTTLMVGFPGETDDIYRELYDFVETAEFDHLGTFIYSPEKGTSAARLKGAPDQRIAEMRIDAIMRLQTRISREKNQRLVNQTVPVLIEGFSPETDLLLTGRTETMAPEVDGRVLINRGKGVVGEITSVLIKEAHAYDLVGEII
ncbi:30S ribosomal protein S12 methylthiotransferase RimO [Deltaproteobacteria bacterium]|nr:30S ribosomal protein S12 methylthiotransferase RimO [Deltaproteobacteria bacterium]